MRDLLRLQLWLPCQMGLLLGVCLLLLLLPGGSHSAHVVSQPLERSCHSGCRLHITTARLHCRLHHQCQLQEARGLDGRGAQQARQVQRPAAGQ
jgi:hypothetical protein